MSGVLHSRLPGDDTGDIHLWKKSEDDGWVTYCGENPGDTKPSMLVTQKEGFKDRNEGYCDDCLDNNPKIPE
jgi:hypothetical protein